MGSLTSICMNLDEPTAQKCTACAGDPCKHLLSKITPTEELKIVERSENSLKQRVIALERELAHSALQLSQASMTNGDLRAQVVALVTIADEQQRVKRSRIKKATVDPVIINENQNVENQILVEKSSLLSLESL